MSSPEPSYFSDNAVVAPRHMGSVNWRGMWELYLKEIKRFWKVGTQTVLAPMVTTLMFLIIFMFAFGRDRATVAGVSFSDFLAPGLIMMAMIQNAFANTSSSVLMAKVQGNIVDVLMPPLSATELMTAYVAGAITRGLAVGITCAIAMSFFADLHIHAPWAIVFHAIMGCMFMAVMGLLGAVWAEKFDHMAAVTNFIITPLTFLSGTFYTIDRLPEGFRFIANYNPFYYAIDGFRYGFLGQETTQPLLGVIVVLGTNLVLGVGCFLLLRSGYKLKA